jgi:hypothetical protein
MEHYWLDLPGPNWFSGSALYSRFVAGVTGHAVAVELGSWKGRSTSFMGVEIANSGKSIEFHTVDHWRGSPGEGDHKSDSDVINGRLFEVFEANIAPIAQYVEPIRSDTVEAASRFADSSVDFLYIDAAHDYRGVLRDLDAWFPKVKPDGLISGDDWDFVVEGAGEFGVRHAVLDFLGPHVDCLHVEDSFQAGTDKNWPQWSFVKTAAIAPSSPMARRMSRLRRAPQSMRRMPGKLKRWLRNAF